MKKQPYFVFRLKKENTDFVKNVIFYIEEHVKPYFMYNILFTNKKFIFVPLPVSTDEYEIYSFFDIETLKLSFSFLQKFELNPLIHNILILYNKSQVFDGINNKDIDENFIIFHNMKVLYLKKDDKIHQYDLILDEKDYIFDINKIK
jgi:hypothetical protein